VVADLLARELDLPVFLYGVLAGGRTRAQLRRGGRAELQRRIAAGELEPDFGPPRLHPTAGATLVAARAPLVAFNLELAPPADLERARAIAALIREGGDEGLPGLRAIAVELGRRDGTAQAQVSMNVEDPIALPLAAVVAAVRRHAEIRCGELVGLAPAAALEGFPPDVELRGFDPGRHLLENALGL
jgi:glutamate formiminotransferase/glutamate formiminotransferase/formiminotetrahydrofolate cyclodeaminase